MKSIFKKLTPDLMVADVAKTVKFYTEKLGFNLAMLVPENENIVVTSIEAGKKYVYAMVVRGEVFVMFMEKEVYTNDVPALKGVPFGASATFYCEVENIKLLYDEYKNTGVEIVKPLHTTWYGMNEFYIRDYNGYILGFAEQAK